MYLWRVYVIAFIIHLVICMSLEKSFFSGSEAEGYVSETHGGCDAEEEEGKLGNHGDDLSQAMHSRPTSCLYTLWPT